MRQVAVAAVLVLAVSACSGSTGGSADDPAGLYTANCAACHAGDGSGGVGPALSGYSDGDMEAAIRNGARGMPAYEGRLRNAEIDALVTHIQQEFG